MKTADKQARPLPGTADFAKSPNWGIGGRYVFDPASGRREPVREAQAAGAQQEQPAAPIKPVKSVKEKKRG